MSTTKERVRAQLYGIKSKYGEEVSNYISNIRKDLESFSTLEVIDIQKRNWRYYDLLLFTVKTPSFFGEKLLLSEEFIDLQHRYNLKLFKYDFGKIVVGLLEFI